MTVSATRLNAPIRRTSLRGLAVLCASLCMITAPATVFAQSLSQAQIVMPADGPSSNPHSPDGSPPLANATPQPVQPRAGLENEAGQPLLIGAGDLLEVSVFDTPELSGKFRVDANGEITLAVGGSVHVMDLTAEQAGAALQARFRERDILRDPHVTVFVAEYATQGVSVMGEVKQPGIYPLHGRHGVLDFISVAGGLTPFASKTATLVHRNSGGQSVNVNLDVSAHQLSADDVEVQPGDRIVVVHGGVVYVLGDVGKPGGYLIENQDKISVLQALALAQGMNKTAKSTASLIRVTVNGREAANLPLKKILSNQITDPKLQDGDILYVPLSGAKNWTDKTMTAILQMAVGVVIYGRY